MQVIIHYAHAVTDVTVQQLGGGLDNPTYCTTVPPQQWIFYIVTFLVVSRKGVLVLMLSMNFKHNKWTRSTSTDGTTKHVIIIQVCTEHSGT